MDIEKWIDSHTVKLEYFGEPAFICRPADLRAMLFAGKVLVEPKEGEYVTVRTEHINWLKEKFPDLCVKSGLCERIAGRLYTKTIRGYSMLAASQEQGQ